jgi:hypothetical protein
MNQKKSKIQTKHKVVLRLTILMAEHRIRFVTDLWKLLLAQGTVDISHSQLTRVVNNTANKLDVALLEGLAAVFDCPIPDLFER